MKPYETYQYLEGTQRTKRDMEEIGSDFWNEGKFNNFVRPFLKETGTLVDMGCNAGLHLKMAEDMGFRAIGVDSNRTSIERGRKWRDSHGYKYRMIHEKMEDVIDQLPIVDYTVFINAHYYMTVNDFLDYLDKLQYKTRYCIIVTDEKNHINRCWASADITTIRSYFRHWKEVGSVGILPQKGKHARKLQSICFKSDIELYPIDKLDSSNHVQDEFCGELDEGKHYKDTKYYYIMKRYRKKWSEERLHKWFEKRVDTYNDIKENGLREPIIVDQKDEILDGNHRYAAIRNLGFSKIYIRRV